MKTKKNKENSWKDDKRKKKEFVNKFKNLDECQHPRKKQTAFRR